MENTVGAVLVVHLHQPDDAPLFGAVCLQLSLGLRTQRSAVHEHKMQQLRMKLKNSASWAQECAVGAT